MIVTEPEKIATQVQTLETSNLPKISKNFRNYSAGGCEDELEASKELYESVDHSQGSSIVENFKQCRCFSWFTVSFVTRKVRVAANSCRLRWCPLCSQALTRYRTHSIQEWLDNEGTARFLTLTLKHSTEPLAQQINNIYYYFKQLRKIKYFKQVVTGGIWFFQIKRSSRTGEWHPHLHCLVTGSYIIHPRLSVIWERITHGSTVVDIRTIRDENSISKYVSRYSSRPATLTEYSLNDRLEIYAVMNNRRLCGKWGTGRSCSLTPPKGNDLSEWRKIGKWSTVVGHAPFHAYSRLILKCWIQGREIPDYIDLQCLDREEHLLTDQDMESLVLLEFYEGYESCE